MKISEILKTSKECGVKASAESCTEWLINHGYIKSEAYGWELPENLERFGLSPNDTIIPGQQYKKYKTREKKGGARDSYGNRVSNDSIMEKVWTGEYFIGASENYLMYRDWKIKKQYAMMKNAEFLKNLVVSP